MKQLITPNPNIECAPGWCLQYVRQTYGLPARYGSATEAWEMSESKHADRNFPAGVWTPVWYGLDTTPLGHVVLLAPDGSVYSTSDLGNVPHHHPNLMDLENYYAYYGMALQYRGWTEDVAGYAVMEAEITAQSVEIEDEMSQAQFERLEAILTENQRRINETQRRVTLTLNAVKEIATQSGVAIDYAKIDQIIDSSLAAGVDVRVTVGK